MSLKQRISGKPALTAFFDNIPEIRDCQICEECDGLKYTFGEKANSQVATVLGDKLVQLISQLPDEQSMITYEQDKQVGLNTLCLCTLVVIAIKTASQIREEFEKALGAKPDL